MQPPRHKPTMKVVRHWGLSLLLFAVPAFVLWLATLQWVWLPGLATIEEKLLGYFFQSIELTLRVQADKEGHWVLENVTNLDRFMQGGSTFFIKGWSFDVYHLYQFTQGLPLLWTLLLAIPRRRVVNLLLGTFILSLLIVGAVWIKLWTLVVRGVSTMPTTVLPPGGHLPDYPSWVLSLAHPLSDLALYASTLVLPIVLGYLLNRAFVRELLPGPGKG